MKKHLRNIICVYGIVGLGCALQAGTVTTTSAPLAPSASNPSGGLYLNAGVSFQGDFDVSSYYYDNSSSAFSFTPGIRVDLGYGFNFAQNFTLQLETGIIYNALDTFNESYTNYYGQVHHSANADGELLQIPFFANLLYNIPINPDFKVYFGVGAGVSVSFLTTWGETSSAAAFICQGIVGTSYKVSDSIDIGLAYKIMGTSSQSFDQSYLTYNGYNWVVAGSTTPTWEFDSSINQSILATLTFKF